MTKKYKKPKHKNVKGKTIEEIKEEDIREEIAEVIVSVLKCFYEDEMGGSPNGEKGASSS